MIRTDFSNSGLKVGENSDNLTYAYGLGDFFSLMFEDTAVPNLLLECDTLTASEVYSRFLQLTSTLSLEDIQTTIGSQIKLALITSSDLVEGTLSTYRLPVSVVSSRYVANRPLLPTELLENKVDFDIYQGDDGSSYIRFAKALSEHSGYAFSNRVLSDGTTQYAIWLVDAHVDERLVSYFFGNLLKVGTNNSSEAFANFVYGLYYVYTQGPTLTVLKRGLNLVLGIPLARLEETVIDIRMYLQTDQYIVLTDQNQYIIPYGLPPSVAVGDTLSVGQELAEWIEVKDYENDGEWWANLYVPTTLIPEPPSGYSSRYATSGSTMDFIMRKYLKTHTFLVRVNVTTFKNLQTFAELINVIRQSKPSYTQPIYVWAVGNDEVIGLEESMLGIEITQGEDIDIGSSYAHMRRSATSPLTRAAARFIRLNAPASMSTVLGEDTRLSSSSNNVQLISISGYANPQSVTRGNTWEELDWLNVLATRSSDTWRGKRGQVGYRRGNVVSYIDPVRSGEYVTLLDSATPPVSGWSQTENASVDQVPVNSTRGLPQETALHGFVPLSAVFHDIPPGSRIVPLAVLLREEVEQKLSVLGKSLGTAGERLLIKVSELARYINSHFINYPVLDNSLQSLWGSDPHPSPLSLVRFFGTRHYRLCSEDPVDGYWLNPPPSMNKDMCAAMLYQGAASIEAVAEGDFLLITDITCSLKAVYLVTLDAQSDLPSCLPVEEKIEPVSATVSGLASRGMATHNSPFYLRRGSLTLVDQTVTPVVPRPEAALLAFLESNGIPDGSKVIPLTALSNSEVVDKSMVWGDTLSPADQYTLLSHPYPLRVAAESGLKKAPWFSAVSPALNLMYQDSAGTITVTGYEQPVGLVADRYGIGGDAFQTSAVSRPVVSARYNKLRYTSFEGTVTGSASTGTGTPPTDWAVQVSSSAAYIGQYSNGVIRLESASSTISLQQNQVLPALVQAKYRMVVAFNTSGLSLRELIDVVVVSGTCTVVYKVNGVVVDASTYVPQSNAEVVSVVSNTLASDATIGLRFGIGLYSATLSQTVTSSAAFKEPDYRYANGLTVLPSYQKVGNPVSGTSTSVGTPDYDSTGFPPYLSFDGVNDYLIVRPPNPLGSYKVSSFVNFTRTLGSSTATIFEALFQTPETLALDLNFVSNTYYASASAGIKVSSGTSVSTKVTSPLGSSVEYSYPNSSYPTYGTFTSLIDTQSDLGPSQLRLYRDSQSISGTPVSNGPVEAFSFQSVQIYLGASISLTEFFKGELYSFVFEAQAADVSDRIAIENWMTNDLSSGRTVQRASLYHYPDFFRRDSVLPSIPDLGTGTLFEYSPPSTLVDSDWGYDRVLAYRYSRDASLLYWICSRDVSGPTDYWTVSYQDEGSFVRTDSGVPSQQGKVVVQPFKAPTSLNYDYLSLGVNSVDLNSLVDTSSAVFSYSDYANSNIAVSRSGMVLTQAVAVQ